MTDGVTNGTTTITSATAAFTAQMVGNAMYVTGGTGSVAADRYFIVTFTNSTTVVVDRSTGLTAGTGVTLNVGGALATGAEAFSARGGIGSNTFWFKVTGTLSTTATMTPPGGANDKPTGVFGYTSSRGDNGQVTVQISSGSFYIFTLSNSIIWLKNFILDCNSAASSRGVSGNLTQCLVHNCTVKNFTDFGFVCTAGNLAAFSNCLAVSNGTGATAGFYSAGTTQFDDCAAVGLTCKGWRMDAGSIMTNCVSANNSGATSDGLFINASNAPRLTNCVLYNNGRAGLYLGANGATNALFMRNCIIAKNGGYGVDNETATAALSTEMLADYNFFWSNSSGPQHNFPAGAHDVTGTGDPFVNPAGSVTTLADVWANFALNNTAGAGAACRGAAYP